MTAPPQKSPTQEVVAWVRSFIDHQLAANRVVQLPDVANAAVAHFATDASFVDRFLHEQFRPIVYDLAQRKAAQTRSGMIVYHDQLATRETVRAQIAKSRPKWAERLYQTSAGHKRLFDMTVEECFDTARLYEDRARSNAQEAALLREIGEELATSTLRTVGELFRNNEDELTKLAASLHITVEIDVDRVDLGDLFDDPDDSDPDDDA